jgi:hypothetical protein
VTAFSVNYQRLRKATLDRLTHVFLSSLGMGPLEPEYVDVQANMLGMITEAAQMIVGQMTSSDMAQKFGGKPLSVNRLITVRDSGITKAQEYQRPFWEVAKAGRNGNPQPHQPGLVRLQQLADTDLQMAKVRQAQISLRAVGAETYRRVTTSDDPCGLCEIAATQIYYTDQLMPIHDRCACDIVPDNFDPADDFDGIASPVQQKGAIDALNEKGAGVEDYQDLIAVRQHGEVGPMLTWAAQHFMGPEDLPRQSLTFGPKRFGPDSTPDESKQRQLAMQMRQLSRSIQKGGGKDFRRFTDTPERKAALAKAKELLKSLPA